MPSDFSFRRANKSAVQFAGTAHRAEPLPLSPTGRAPFHTSPVSSAPAQVDLIRSRIKRAVFPQHYVTAYRRHVFVRVTFISERFVVPTRRRPPRKQSILSSRPCWRPIDDSRLVQRLPTPHSSLIASTLTFVSCRQQRTPRAPGNKTTVVTGFRPSSRGQDAVHVHVVSISPQKDLTM